jgi:hypothetical protein
MLNLGLVFGDNIRLAAMARGASLPVAIVIIGVGLRLVA